MTQLITICCYFGTLPEHFPEFMRSVAMNPTVDFLLVTDCEVTCPPKNMRVYQCSLAELKERLQVVAGFPIVLDRPYKLCDFKPIWGPAFREMIEEYDFWGHCDMDLIFGDIRAFLSDDIFEKYDKIYQLGHLLYYRNTEEVTLRYRLDGGMGYREAFTSPQIVAFDEIAGMGNIYQKHSFPAWYALDYADITYGKVRFTRSLFHVPAELHEEFNYEKQLFYWEDGRVFRAYLKDGQILRDEFNYIHFSRRKMTRNGLPAEARSYFITNRGLFEKTGEVTLEDFDKYNPTEPKKEAQRTREIKKAQRRELRGYYWKILKQKLGFQ